MKRKASEDSAFARFVRDPSKVARMRTPEALDRLAARRKDQGRARTETVLGWCPPEYRPLYRRLRRHRSAAEARKLVTFRFGGAFRPVSMSWPQYLRGECSLEGGNVIRLGERQREIILALLLASPDRYVPIENLIEAIWPNPDLEPDYAIGVFKVALWSLRKKGVPIVISTTRTHGYRIPRSCRWTSRTAVVTNDA